MIDWAWRRGAAAPHDLFPLACLRQAQGAGPGWLCRFEEVIKAVFVTGLRGGTQV